MLLVEKEADVNAQGGFYGNALQAALSEGREAIVWLLLEKEADVDAVAMDALSDPDICNTPHPLP
jgi:ankyrin repeat protein